MENSWIIVGIGGTTCSGKTTVCEELHKRIPDSVLIHQDHYYHEKDSGVLEYIEEVQHYNWDSLSAIDVDRLVRDVVEILKNPGKSCTPVLIIEGHLIYNIERVIRFCTLKYFMTVSREVCKFRRRTRKYKRYDERYFDQYAWPIAESNAKDVMNKIKDIIVVDGEAEADANVNRILGDIEKLLKVAQIPDHEFY